MPVAIVWFRRDLCLVDHAPLAGVLFWSRLPEPGALARDAAVAAALRAAGLRAESLPPVAAIPHPAPMEPHSR